MQPIISAQEALRRHIAGNARFIDCRFSLADHDAGVRDWTRLRVPNSQHLHMEHDLAGHCTGFNGRHPLPSSRAFETSLRRAGISGGDAIVLYDDQRLAGASRAWWLLRYFGVANVHIIDGGFRAWRAAGGPVTTTTPVKNRPGNIRIEATNESLIVTKSQIAASISGFQPIVDAREPVRFRGEAEPIDPIPGRIPTATNLPWTDVTTPEGFVYPEAMQRARWRLTPESPPPILYCGSGVTASVNALSRVIAGLCPGVLYAGSYSEWCSDPSMPIARDNPG